MTPIATSILVISSLYVLNLLLPIHATAKKIARFVLTKSFYNGFNQLADKLMKERSDQLLADFHGERFLCQNNHGSSIDATYVPSYAVNKTGNVVVICLNTTYQDHHPRHWQPLIENGADVLLWNPTRKTPVNFADDLTALLQKLRTEKPTQVIAVKSYCASADPAIAAVDRMEDPNIHQIIDRGHGNAQKLARSITLFAGLGFVKEVIQEEFDCHGIDRIHRIQGRSLFMTPHLGDQVMNCGATNLTKELFEQTRGQTIIELDRHDHWSKWDHVAYDQVLTFLSEIGVVKSDFTSTASERFPSIEAPGCFKRSCIPILIKTCV